jgi:hypothetical protein
VSHSRDAASWCWPGQTCWHELLLAGRGVELSEVEAGAAETTEYGAQIRSRRFSGTLTEKEMGEAVRDIDQRWR